MFEGICMRRYLRKVSPVSYSAVRMKTKSCIPNKEDADAGIILRTNKTEVIFQVVQAGLGDCIAVEVILSHMLASLVYDTLVLEGY